MQHVLHGLGSHMLAQGAKPVAVAASQDSLGPQQLLTLQSAPVPGFGTCKRPGMAERMRAPGPGAYKARPALGAPLHGKSQVANRSMGAQGRRLRGRPAMYVRSSLHCTARYNSGCGLLMPILCTFLACLREVSLCARWHTQGRTSTESDIRSAHATTLPGIHEHVCMQARTGQHLLILHARGLYVATTLWGLPINAGLRCAQGSRWTPPSRARRRWPLAAPHATPQAVYSYLWTMRRAGTAGSHLVRTAALLSGPNVYGTTGQACC